MARVVVDDHLLRDVLTGQRTADLDGLAPDGIATTGMWLFRLCSSFAGPRVSGKLTASVALLSEEQQQSFRAQMITLPADIAVLARVIPVRVLHASGAVVAQVVAPAALMPPPVVASRYTGHP